MGGIHVTCIYLHAMSLSKVTGVSKVTVVSMGPGVSKVTIWGFCLRLLMFSRLLWSLSKVTVGSKVTAWGLCLRLLDKVSKLMHKVSKVIVVPKINGVFV